MSILSTALSPIKRRIFMGVGIVTLLAIVGLVAWALRLDMLREGWKGRYGALRTEANAVLVALRNAADNPKLEWEQASGQVVALGESNRSLKRAISQQNQAIDEMAREAVRLQARGEELRKIARLAETQRKAALDRLGDMAIAPGTRDDCMLLLAEAEAALDIVYEAGL